MNTMGHNMGHALNLRICTLFLHFSLFLDVKAKACPTWPTHMQHVIGVFGCRVIFLSAWRVNQTDFYRFLFSLLTKTTVASCSTTMILSYRAHKRNMWIAYEGRERQVHTQRGALAVTVPVIILILTKYLPVWNNFRLWVCSWCLNVPLSSCDFNW